MRLLCHWKPAEGQSQAGYFVIVAVDSSNNWANEWGYSGDRYIWGITIDSVARTVVFKGQSCGYPNGPDPDGSGIVIMAWDSHYPPVVE